ncbi:thiamine monophosphate synthase [Galbibacter marinus]|uniref:Thiamine monophosphate synthase n=1 Tax=Galbibacter marinus TaxID=555500 RepID=K2PZ88_9FLAO|nr:thiamine phosphate synthase [Galbibacter marinus]EKF53946.1 thiamine monophosphate synthase [Galbibacter marinus]
MFLLITAQNNVEDETRILEQATAFDNCFIHVRKPDFTLEQMQQWLNQFSNRTIQKMVLHQHHHLCADFPLKGIHFKESEKNNVGKVERPSELTISAAFHDPFQACWQSRYNYAVLSPVFDSISKTHLKGKSFQIRNSFNPIIALGGITTKNMKVACDLGYNGIAVLGSVWLSNEPLRAFKDIVKTYQKVYG